MSHPDRFLLAGVMGWPVMHSRSPMLHNYWFDEHKLAGRYVPLAIEPGKLVPALRALAPLGFAGCNLTIPHKEAALTIVDEIAPTARKMGAISCVTVGQDGRLTGTNNDGYGYIHALIEAAPDWRADGGPIVVIGSGGGARADDDDRPGVRLPQRLRLDEVGHVAVAVVVGADQRAVLGYRHAADRAHLLRGRRDFVDDGECGFLVRDRQIAAREAQRRQRTQCRPELARLDRQRNVAASELVVLEPVVVQMRRARMHHRPAHHAGKQETIGMGHVGPSVRRRAQSRVDAYRTGWRETVQYAPVRVCAHPVLRYYTLRSANLRPHAVLLLELQHFGGMVILAIVLDRSTVRRSRLTNAYLAVVVQPGPLHCLPRRPCCVLP